MSTSAVSKSRPKTSAASKKAAPAKKAVTANAPPPDAAPPQGASTPEKKAATAPASPAAKKMTETKVPLSKNPGEKPIPAPTAKTAAKTASAAPKPAAPAKKIAPAPQPAEAGPAKAAKAADPAPAKTAVVAPVMPPGVVPRKPGRGTPKYFVAPVQAPLPAPTSRFADRFAPPRPPTRQMSQVEVDTPRQAHKADPKLANAWKSKAGRDLTDDEVQAMPEAEYMNDKQLEFFRTKLQALKDDLLSNAGETTEHLREDTSIVPDPADRATIEEEHALELRTRDRERKLLKKISQSLGRIESGEYGFCDETGEPIGLGRLIARPTATLSLEAQQRRELKQKMFGD